MGESRLETLYSTVILDRARRPLHQRRLEPFDSEAEEINPLCGDRVTLRLRGDPAGRIEAAGYEARACAICAAAADFLAELVPGMTAAAAVALGRDFEAALRTPDTAQWDGPMAPLRVFAPLHETPSRIGCAALPWHALARLSKS